MARGVTSVNEQDFLDQDPPLRNQNYVCLSFISPEEVIKKKESYFFENFVKGFAGEMQEFFKNMMEKYKDDADVLTSIKERYFYLFDTDKIQEEFDVYLGMNGQRLEQEYFEKNEFQTTIRGIKVRGVFDNMKEAELRAKVLKKMDDKFHVYVAQVGCWCPWNPNPDDIDVQEYAEDHLNTLVKNYKDNQDKKDEFFQMRKRELQAFGSKGDGASGSGEGSGEGSVPLVAEVSDAIQETTLSAGSNVMEATKTMFTEESPLTNSRV